MLTIDTIKANVEGLTDEQYQTLATLSENDEKSSFSAKFAEIHNSIDEKVLAATSIKREGNEKSTEYMTRAFGLYAAQFADAKTAKSYSDEIAALKADNEKLKAAQTADESDKIKALTAELNNTKGQFNELNAKYEASQKDFDKKLNDYKIRAAVESAVTKFSFKDNNAEMLALAKNAAIAAVMGKNPQLTEIGIVFTDDNGATLNNPNNKLNPYTTEELLKAEFDKYGILKDKPKAGGAGGKQDVTQSNPIGYKTQSQAMDFIQNRLRAEGLIQGSYEYQMKVNEFWNSNNIQNLPIE